jgi:hypothetical protein
MSRKWFNPEQIIVALNHAKTAPARAERLAELKIAAIYTRSKTKKIFDMILIAVSVILL